MSDNTIAITGASGMIGSALAEHFEGLGWSVVPMVRSRQADGIYWSIDDDEIDVQGLEGVDVVVHLAGEPIADGRWTKSRKQKILNSRTRGTRLVAEAIAALEDPPDVMVCASGSNYYGDTGDDWVDEADDNGEGFLADVVRQWEEACEPARDVCRVVNTRFGMVLSAEGGALGKMLPIFKLAVGGRISDGTQFMSWVAIDDLVRAVEFVVDHEELEGPVNVSSPNPVRNREFTKALGEAIGRPTPFPVPAPALKLLYGGEMVEETLLLSQRLRPGKLVEAGFEFEYPEIDQAFEAVL